MLPSTDTLRRVVHLDDLWWLAAPGEYLLRAPVDRADRARLSRRTRKAGNTFRSSRGVDGLLVDIWRGSL